MKTLFLKFRYSISIFFGVLFLVLFSSPSFAQDTAANNLKALNSGVSYQYLGQYSTAQLNSIMTSEKDKFSAFKIKYPSAKYPVNLYKVSYPTVIPEENNRSTIVSGLIAIPMQEKKRIFPLLSYQHGTIFDRGEVPSNFESSMETRLMVANFAAQGYIVIAADYVGVGGSKEPNSWLVKDTSAQTCYDMLLASKAVFSDLGITTGNLFISGWSQGSFTTLAFMHKLEQNGIPVTAAAVSSSPNDIYLAFNRWIFARSAIDADYLVGTAVMLVFAYENYYGLSGLAQAAIKPEYYQIAKDFYEFKINWEQAAKVLHHNPKDLFQTSFLTALAAGESPLAKILKNNNSYDWQYKTPSHFYYGEVDEVMNPYQVKLAVEYQKTIAGIVPTAIDAGAKADHRGTFLFGIKDQKHWFDSLTTEKSD